MAPGPETPEFQEQEKKLLKLSTREELARFSKEFLLQYFVPGNKLDEATGFLSGKVVFRKNERLERFVGLKHLIHNEYQSITVTTPKGEVIHGIRKSNGSFYDDNGHYIAIWENYSFEARKEPRKKNSPPSPTIMPPVRKAEVIPETRPEQTILFGDSLTVGYRTYLEGTHVPIDSTPALGGKGTGFMLTQMKLFLQRKPERVTKVVILGGVNDIVSGRPVKRVTDNLQEMYRLARDAGLKVVACTIPRWNTEAFTIRKPEHCRKHRLSPDILEARTREVNAWILSQSDVAKIDLYARMDFQNFKRTPDGLHLTNKGNRAMASLIREEAGILSG